LAKKVQKRITIREASRTNFNASEMASSIILRVPEILPRIMRILIALKVERS
jgi:hypothetical protein